MKREGKVGEEKRGKGERDLCSRVNARFFLRVQNVFVMLHIRDTCPCFCAMFLSKEEPIGTHTKGLQQIQLPVIREVHDAE